MFIGIGLGLVAQAIYGGVGDNALNDYGTPHFLADFIESEYRNNGPLSSSFTALTGLTFTRASTGYAQTAAGVLVPFASGAPRITDKGLLIEGAMTNLCLRSQEFDNAFWSKTNITLSADAGIAPDGTQTADLFTVTSTAVTTTSIATGSAVVVSGTNCAATVYVENVSRTGTNASFILRDHTAATNKITGTLNWDAMTISGTGASIARLGSTNWYRITLVDSAWTSGNAAILYVGSIGLSLTAGQAWHAWGAQLEAAAFPSSYIPTTTTSATRAADVASIAVSGLAYPVTMFAEFERVVDTATNEGLLGMGAGGGEFSEVMINTIDVARGVVQDGGAAQIDQSIGNTYALGVTGRMAMRVAANDCRIQGNGNAATDATATMPDAPTSIYIGTRGGSGSPSFGYLRRAAVYGRAFSDAELQSISA